MINEETIKRLEELEAKATPKTWENIMFLIEFRDHARELLQAARENLKLRKALGEIKDRPVMKLSHMKMINSDKDYHSYCDECLEKNQLAQKDLKEEGK